MQKIKKPLPCAAAMHKIKSVLEKGDFTMLELCTWAKENNTNYKNFIAWINTCLKYDGDCKRCTLGI